VVFTAPLPARQPEPATEPASASDTELEVEATRPASEPLIVYAGAPALRESAAERPGTDECAPASTLRSAHPFMPAHHTDSYRQHIRSQHSRRNEPDREGVEAEAVQTRRRHFGDDALERQAAALRVTLREVCRAMLAPASALALLRYMDEGHPASTSVVASLESTLAAATARERSLAPLLSEVTALLQLRDEVAVLTQRTETSRRLELTRGPLYLASTRRLVILTDAEVSAAEAALLDAVGGRCGLGRWARLGVRPTDCGRRTAEGGPPRAHYREGGGEIEPYSTGDEVRWQHRCPRPAALVCSERHTEAARHLCSAQCTSIGQRHTHSSAARPHPYAHFTRTCSMRSQSYACILACGCFASSPRACASTAAAVSTYAHI
jgi:hypothetical protein